MAASTQERLKLKQYQVDTWTTREQLCLASAVVRSGDQNWVAVRRNIKMLTNETSRPPDWYSTKNCALQYARLLERVDTPKRKRERCDGGNETPGEIVTKMLSKQRIEELQALKAKEKTSYNQLRCEIEQLEAGKLDHQLDAFWEHLVKEQSEEEEEEQRQQQWLKEREEKITAIQQALKHQGPKAPQPPHKKKPKLQAVGVGVVGGVCGENRRSSGLSETSSELDSAVDSPDINEVTSESILSNKSQDDSCGGESEVKPTPTSPLLSSLLSKSPITGLPMAASSPLTQLGVGGGRAMRGVGISPVSQALQNLVSSAISGTSTAAVTASASSSDKDKTTPATPSSNTTGGSTSTLSLLLDLPPSTPGGPLPSLSDLPGTTFEQHNDSEKKSGPKSKSDKSEQSCTENNGCGEQDNTEQVTPDAADDAADAAATSSSNTTHKTDGATDLKEEKDAPPTEVKDDNKKEEIKEAATGRSQECKDDKKDTSDSQSSSSSSSQTLEGNVSKKESRTSHKEEKEKCDEQSEGDVKTEDNKEQQQQQEKKEEAEVQNKMNKETQPVKVEETKTEVKADLDSTKETSESTKKDEETIDEKEVKIEGEKEVECSSSSSSVGKDEDKSENTPSSASSKVSEKVSGAGVSSSSSEGEKGECSSSSSSSSKCGSDEKKCCTTKEETGCGLKKTEDDKEVTTKKEKKAAGKCSDDDDDVAAESDVKVEEEEEEEEERKKDSKEEEKKPATTETENVKKTNNKQKEEETIASSSSSSSSSNNNKSVCEEEQQQQQQPPPSLSKMSKSEDVVTLTSEGEKKPKKMTVKKEQEEDHLESQDSRDGVSEDDGSTIGSRKRKISVGDILGSSSPLISESAPNSPASTHYGDDSESERAYRSWKKPIMILWNDIAAHKCASLFLRPITDDHAPGYHSIVYRPMDLQKIKRKIESGAIRTTAEFQRDIMLMFLNATMYNTRDHNVYHMAHQMMKDAVSTIQDFLTTQMLMRAEETPQKSLRRETRESSSKRSDEDSKRKRDPLDEKILKKRRTN